ncbi:hypothetical protein C0989_010447, partial [Termitomyces sp. Mn162]
TLSQLLLKSAQLFIINVSLNDFLMVLPTLINSRAFSTFVSKQLDLPHNTLNKLLEFQLFDQSPASSGITQYHNSALTLNNNFRFQVWLLAIQLLELTPIVLGLP